EFRRVLFRSSQYGPGERLRPRCRGQPNRQIVAAGPFLSSNARFSRPDLPNLAFEVVLPCLDPRRVVSLRDLDGAVSQQLGNAVERGALEKQRHRERVAKAMRVTIGHRRFSVLGDPLEDAVPALDNALGLAAPVVAEVAVVVVGDRRQLLHDYLWERTVDWCSRLLLIEKD